MFNESISERGGKDFHASTINTDPIPELTKEQVERVTALVERHANDEADLKDLMEVLGL